MTAISNEARERINEAAKEIIGARTDAEYAEAIRAMAAVLAFYEISA